MTALAIKAEAHSPPPDIQAMSAEIRQSTRSLVEAAARCDKICLEAGGSLIEAITSQNALGARFETLSATLAGDDLTGACRGLQTVTAEIVSVSERISLEGQSLNSLIDLNLALSHSIAIVADDIRFLAAMVPVVKVEAVSIDDDVEGLQGFGEILEDLSSKARSAIGMYQTAHAELLSQLNQAHTLQAAFEARTQMKLKTAAASIDSSLAAVTARRERAAGVITKVAECIQRIGAGIGDVVVALQLGDTMRQRIEHAHAIAQISAHDALACDPRDALSNDSPRASRFWFVFHRTCELSAMQISGACEEFSAEVQDVVARLSSIGEATSDIMQMSADLFKSDGGSASTFLGELESDLKSAWALIGEYTGSRAKIDDAMVSVAATFANLEVLGSNVASLITDMTIIGTNAIIKSHRLGIRGAGLSVIAQHLRGHALKVASGIKVLSKQLHEVLAAARDFTDTLSGNGVDHMKALSSEATQCLETFQTSGGHLSVAMKELEVETAASERNVRLAIATLFEIAAIEKALLEVAGNLNAAASQIDGLGLPDGDAEDTLDGLIRPLYSMQPERRIHDSLFNSSRSPQPVETETWN